MLAFTGCGGLVGEGGGQSASPVGINLVVTNPDPNATGKAAKALVGGSSADISVAKSDSRASLSSCTLTVSGADMSTVTKTASVAANASSVAFDGISIPVGSSRAFSVSCVDSSKATNDINVGFTGQTNADISANSATTVSMSGKFLNLIADDSDGVEFIRINEENATQTKVGLGFGKVLSATEKADFKCILEFDTTGSRSSPGSIDANQTNGLSSTSPKPTPYAIINGGISKPSAFFYNTSGTKGLRMNCAWSTTSAGNTSADCTFSIANMQSNIDSDEEGQLAAVCSLTGASPWDSIPNSGYAKYVMNTFTNKTIGALSAVDASCNTSTNGETCGSGYCGPGGTCISLSLADNLGPSGVTISDFAGSSSGDVNDVGTAAKFHFPTGICISPDGSTLFVGGGASGQNIRKIVSATGTVTTLAGLYNTAGTADGTGTDARFSSPQGCVVDPTGTNLYVADQSNHSIRKIVISTGVVTTLAGLTGTSGSTDGTGSNARFNTLLGIAIDHDGTNLYVPDGRNHAIRKIVVSTGVVTTFAGSLGTSGNVDGIGTSALLNRPRHIAIDSTDTFLYFTQGVSGGIHTTRKINIATQEVTTIAGSSTASSVDGTGTGASFNLPTGIVVDPTDSFLYIADANGFKVRKMDVVSGVVATVAGTGTSGSANGNGVSATLFSPWGMAISPDGKQLYLVDSSNHRIRLIQIQ